MESSPSSPEHPHSIYGASCAKRWRGCPASANFIAAQKAAGNIPERESSAYAAEGTLAHDWAEKILKDEADAADIVCEEMRWHVKEYVAYCRSLLDSETDCYVEKVVPLYYRPEDVSTLDFAAVHPYWIEFVDLKYGAGVKVAAEDNDQLVIYLLSLVKELEASGQLFADNTQVMLTIYQPRHRSFEGSPETWTTTLGDLREIGKTIAADYHTAVTATDCQLNPSDAACQFCDAKGICPARTDKILDPLVDFDDETLVATDSLTAEQIAFVVTNATAIKKLVEDITKHEYKRLEQGGDVRGLKLVEAKGAGMRKWVDPQAAEAFLKQHLKADERYQPRKLITAPQALTKLKKALPDMSKIARAKLGALDKDEAQGKTACLWHREPKPPTLVVIDDPRPHVIDNAEDNFDDEAAQDFEDLM
jgi:hypothetical protein